MAAPAVSVRLSPETYKKLLRRADVERKTVTELVRELLEREFSAKEAAEQKPDDKVVLQRLDVLEKHIGELLVKAVKAGASGRFLSRLGLSFSSDTVSWLTEQRLADGPSKAKFLAEMEAQADQYSQDYLIKPE